MMASNSKRKDEYHPQAKRAKTTKNVYYCYDCEQEFQPIRKGHKFCAKCTENDRPTVNSIPPDEHYNRGKERVAIPPMYWSRPSSVDYKSKFEPGKDKKTVSIPSSYCNMGKTTVIDDQSNFVPESRPSISSVAVVPILSLLIDQKDKNSNLDEQPKNGFTILKMKEDISCNNITSECETKPSKKFLPSIPSVKDKQKNSSGIVLDEIDLSTSSCDESNNDEKNHVYCMEDVTSSQTTSFIKVTVDACPLESPLLTKPSNIPPDVLSHPTLIPKSANNFKEKSKELHDNSGLSVQGFSQLELDELRVREEELKQIINSCLLDCDEISSLKKRITELESKDSAEKGMLLNKEFEVKSYELKVLQAQCVVETFAEEKDSLCSHIKKTSAALELARSSCDSTEMGVSEFKRKLKNTKEDELLRNYILTILAKKEERARVAGAKVKHTVSQLEEAENDLNKTEEVLKTKEAVHQETLVQWEKLKSELVKLRDIHAHTDQETKLAQSQLNSLRQANNQESIIKYFERKTQLMEIQHKIEALENEERFKRKLEKLKNQRREFERSHEMKFNVMRTDLDAEKESAIQLLS